MGVDAFIKENFFANPDNPPKRIRICGHGYTLDANRWNAFTDEELQHLKPGRYEGHTADLLGSEILAELESRQA
jgi:hypothetical protein